MSWLALLLVIALLNGQLMFSVHDDRSLRSNQVGDLPSYEIGKRMP